MKTLDEVITEMEGCGFIGTGADALHYLKAFRDAKNALDAEREKTIEAYCQWKDAIEKLEAQTAQMMWVDKHFQFEISDKPALTWDGLRQMTGKPVWLESHGDIEEFTGWVIVSSVLSDRARFILSHYDDDDFLTYEMALPNCTFGKTWNVYRKERQ